MEGHDWWHLVVLGSTLLGAGGLLVLLLAPVVFDEPLPGLERVKPFIVGLVAFSAILFAVEWLGVH